MRVQRPRRASARPRQQANSEQQSIKREARTSDKGERERVGDVGMVTKRRNCDRNDGRRERRSEGGGARRFFQGGTTRCTKPQVRGTSWRLTRKMDNRGSRWHVLWNYEEATLHRPGWQSKSRLVYPPVLSLCVCVFGVGLCRCCC